MKQFTEYRELLTDNLTVEHITGDRAYYQLILQTAQSHSTVMWRMNDLNFPIEQQEFYDTYKIALELAVCDPDNNYLLTLCELKNVG